MLADGHISGIDLICSLHGWDYVYMTGVSSYTNSEKLNKFSSWIKDGSVYVDEEEIFAWEESPHSQPYDRSAYQGAWQDPHGTPEEPHQALIRRLGNEGLDYLGHHGPVGSMGVPRQDLPQWDDI